MALSHFELIQKKEAIKKLLEKQKRTEKTFTVHFPSFTVEAFDEEEAIEQACQTFIDYPSSRGCTAVEKN